MMYARCIRCHQVWNIAVGQKIPKGGYICPYCETRERDNRLGQKRKEKSQKC